MRGTQISDGAVMVRKLKLSMRKKAPARVETVEKHRDIAPVRQVAIQAEEKVLPECSPGKRLRRQAAAATRKQARLVDKARDVLQAARDDSDLKSRLHGATGSTSSATSAAAAAASKKLP